MIKVALAAMTRAVLVTCVGLILLLTAGNMLKVDVTTATVARHARENGLIFPPEGSGDCVPRVHRIRQIHCVFMTVPLHFHDMPQAPAASCVSWSSPAKAQRQCRV